LPCSAQEQAIEGGKSVLHGKATDRMLRLFEAIRTAGQPRVALERGIYFTESFKATEGQPLNLRWAIFLRDEDGRRAVFVTCALFHTDPHWRDLIPFHEYFPGDTGRGCGASHQTGWTGLVAQILINLDFDAAEGGDPRAADR
jgi:hypothetical protein